MNNGYTRIINELDTAALQAIVNRSATRPGSNLATFIQETTGHYLAFPTVAIGNAIILKVVRETMEARRSMQVTVAPQRKPRKSIGTVTVSAARLVPQSFNVAEMVQTEAFIAQQRAVDFLEEHAAFRAEINKARSLKLCCFVASKGRNAGTHCQRKPRRVGPTLGNFCSRHAHSLKGHPDYEYLFIEEEKVADEIEELAENVSSISINSEVDSSGIEDSLTSETSDLEDSSIDFRIADSIPPVSSPSSVIVVDDDDSDDGDGAKEVEEIDEDAEEIEIEQARQDEVDRARKDREEAVSMVSMMKKMMEENQKAMEDMRKEMEKMKIENEKLKEKKVPPKKKKKKKIEPKVQASRHLVRLSDDEEDPLDVIDELAKEHDKSKRK